MALDILFIIVMLATIFTLVKAVTLIVKDEYDMGYTDCMRRYFLTKKVTLMREWLSPYARGWNDACKEIANQI